MAGLVDLLSIAKSALQTHQRALDVTGHNIANAATPGYTRQRLDQTEAIPLRTPQGYVGRGVGDMGVVSSRDTFLDTAYRAEQGNFTQADTLHTLVSQVQTMFNEPTDQALGSALDTLWNGFSDLANDPAGGAQRVAVQNDAAQVVQQLHDLDKGLTSVSNTAATQFTDGVARINQIATQVADLNRQIIASGGGADHAGDLADKRGVLLDELGGLVDTRVYQGNSGSVSVVVGDAMIVENGVAQQLQTATRPGGGLDAMVVGDTRALNFTSGKLAGLDDVMTVAVPKVRSALDTLASSLVTTVNAIHQTGMTNASVTGTNFFDPAGTTAASIALAPAIAASPANIVTGTTAAAGDNTIALQLAGLRTAGVPGLGGSSLGDYYTSIVTDLGTTVANADQQSTSAQVISSGISAQRSSETGVSTNEEMISLITQQQSFAAAAKIVTVADSLLQDLLNMI